MTNFRVAVLATIAFLAALIALVGAVAAIFVSSDRGMTIVSVVITGLLSLLPTVIVYLKTDAIESKVDAAADTAITAARHAARAERKIDTVQEFVENGGLRRNVVGAIKEAGDDPEIRRRRIETIAEGVKEDRHETGSREAAAYARGVADAMKRWGGEHGEPVEGEDADDQRDA